MTTSYPSKPCFKCGESKPLTDFYRHPEMKDGRLNKCKSCTRRDVAEHREKNIDRVRAYDRARGGRGSPERTRRYRAKNPEKHAAHLAVRRALRDGVLVRGVCERCGSAEVHGHHDDYGEPLSVMWLCPLHHHERHRELRDGLC